MKKIWVSLVFCMLSTTAIYASSSDSDSVRTTPKVFDPTVVLGWSPESPRKSPDFFNNSPRIISDLQGKNEQEEIERQKLIEGLYQQNVVKRELKKKRSAGVCCLCGFIVLLMSTDDSKTQANCASLSCLSKAKPKMV